MNTWLKLLPRELELQELSELIEPTDEIKEGEKVIGTVSDELKKLHTLWKAMKKSADLLTVELEYKKAADQERGKVFELQYKARALEILFWVGVHDELGLWSHPESCGIRVGWQVVEFKRPEMPFPFKFLLPGQQ